MQTKIDDTKTVRLDKDTHKKLRIKAIEEDKTISETVESLLAQEDKK